MRRIASPPDVATSATQTDPATRWSRRAALGLVAAALAGCGFELRRAPAFRFPTLQLARFNAKSPLAPGMRSTIDASPTTKGVDALAQAEVVLEALSDTREKAVVASTGVGQVTEFTLRARFRFRLRSVAGKELIGPTEILQTRDLSYTESAALGKEQEEASLYR